MENIVILRLFQIFLCFYFGMSVVTFYLYTFNRVKIFDNKHKFTLGLIYTLFAWPHVLWQVMTTEEYEDIT